MNRALDRIAQTTSRYSNVICVYVCFTQCLRMKHTVCSMPSLRLLEVEFYRNAKIEIGITAYISCLPSSHIIHFVRRILRNSNVS